AAIPPRRVPAWPLPLARFALGREPFVRSTSGQEPVSLFSLRRRRQRPGPVGGVATTALARGRARPVPTPGAARALAVRVEDAAKRLTAHRPRIREREPTMPAP